MHSHAERGNELSEVRFRQGVFFSDQLGRALAI